MQCFYLSFSVHYSFEIYTVLNVAGWRLSAMRHDYLTSVSSLFDDNQVTVSFWSVFIHRLY
jgi:hypothetical protein